jgi:hypothetical protein
MSKVILSILLHGLIKDPILILAPSDPLLWLLQWSHDGAHSWHWDHPNMMIWYSRSIASSIGATTTATVEQCSIFCRYDLQQPWTVGVCCSIIIILVEATTTTTVKRIQLKIRWQSCKDEWGHPHWSNLLLELLLLLRIITLGDSVTTTSSIVAVVWSKITTTATSTIIIVRSHH